MWFTVEYILRLAGAPRKGEFLKNRMNIIDVLAILPYFFSIIINETYGGGSEFNDIRRIVQIFRYAISINLIFGEYMYIQGHRNRGCCALLKKPYYKNPICGIF